MISDIHRCTITTMLLFTIATLYCCLHLFWLNLISSVMAAISARIKHEVHNFSCHVLQTHWVTKNHEYEISELFWQFRLRRHHVQCLVLCVRGHGHLLLSLRGQGVPLLQDLLQVVGDHVHGHGGT